MESSQVKSAFDRVLIARGNLQNLEIKLELPAIYFLYLSLDLLAAKDFHIINGSLYRVPFGRQEPRFESDYDLDCMVDKIKNLLPSESAKTLIDWSVGRYSETV